MSETRPVLVDKMDMQLWYRVKLIASQNRESIPEFVQRALRRELVLTEPMKAKRTKEK
jgi:hypothetical protein